MTCSAWSWLGLGYEVSVMCLPGRFLSYLGTLGPIGGILKVACRHFLGDAVSRVFKIGVGHIYGSMGGVSGRTLGGKIGTFAATEGTSGWKTGNSCLEGSAIV